nr:MAG TPA: hypothetical protein [Bacteriophage sp.]
MSFTNFTTPPNVKNGGETHFLHHFPLPFRFFSLSLPSLIRRW